MFYDISGNFYNNSYELFIPTTINSIKETFDLIILVFACYTLEKYKKEIENINLTWGKKCKMFKNIKILYFLGEEKIDGFHDTTQIKYINLVNVKNDYLSASYKQFLGLKYLYENYITKFVMCIGTDTYLNIPKLLKFLNNYDHTDCLYIGDNKCFDPERQIGTKKYYYHDGGPGFIITYDVLKQIYHLLLNLMENWINLCNENNIQYLIPACDVAISYYLQQPQINIKIIKTNELSFLHCNYKGFPCLHHQNKIDISKIISCHCMSEDDFNNFTHILNENNYFV